MGTLFNLEIAKNIDPIQDVDITTLLLYFSTKELKECKTLCKIAIKDIWGAEHFQTKGNIADLFLILLREKYGTKNNM